MSTAEQNDRAGVSGFASFVDVLRARAETQPDGRAYVFLRDRGGEEAVLTFGQLYRRACGVAAAISAQAQKGDRALLLFPPGLEFIIGFFGCLIAGVIAVPMMPPRRAGTRDSSASIVADCSPRLALTSAGLLAARPDLAERFQPAGIDWLIVDTASEEACEPVHMAHDADDLAFLQYTSGSTSAPKGVMVSHRNLLANSEMIRIAFANTKASTIVSWIPLYHDMGLIMNVLQSLYVGTLCVLMAPVSFMQRPLTWLRAIHDYQAEVATAPNFAFELCVSRFRPDQMAGVDLARWRLVGFGAEPVRAETIERFVSTFAPYGLNPKAIYPGYGLAETTLMASGGSPGAGLVTRGVSREALRRGWATPSAASEDTQVVVGCGRSLVGQRIAIVEPESCRRLQPETIGEVWVDGPNVARGYWRNPQATAATFQARIDGEEGNWLRTGDLGFLDAAGELYITGRIKDVIIIRGINHYPQDIEDTVQNSHPALRRNGGAAFSMVDHAGDEKLVVVQEVERTQRRQLAVEDLSGCIREAVATEHEISVDRIVLIRPGALPKTTSGKIQRSLTRQLWIEGRLGELETALPGIEA